MAHHLSTKFGDTCIVLVAIFLFASARGEFMCDEYLQPDGSGHFFTIAGYKLPPTKYSLRLNESIPCPCSTQEPCLRKCCLDDDLFELSTKSCLRSNDSGANRKFESQNLPQIPPGSYTLIFGSFCPTAGRSLETLKVLQNGAVQLRGQYLPLEGHCIDYFREEGDFRLLECQPETPETGGSVQTVFVFCLAISICCLLVTLLVYSCIQSLRNLPGKVLICYVSSMLATESCLVGLLLYPAPSQDVCVATAYIFQFSFSATFFWLNVMCFDLWLAFRGHRFTKQPAAAFRTNKKFILYCLYAWGVPLIISSLTMLIELSIIPGEFVKPEIGQTSCWFKTHEATFWYLYSYTSVLLLLNLYMFLTTLSNLFKREKTRKIFKKDGNKRHNEQEKQRFFSYLKLFLIMGINWIMDVISYYMKDIKSMKYIWFFTDLTSTLQGFLILLIFVCNRKVLKSLNGKLYPNKKFIHQKTMMTTKNSCSSCTTMCPQRGNTQTSLDVEAGNSMQS